MTRPYNFAPGPAMLPESVLKQIQSEMLDFHGCGWSILEASHRGPQVTGVMTELKSRLRQLLSIPDTYDVLFCPGGGRMQFAMVPMNLLGAGTLSTYIITGAWSKAAAKEALRFGRVQSAFSGSGNRIPADEELEVIPETSYCAYCDNETIHGIEFERVPVLKDAEAVPLVADMTSNFLTRPVDVNSGFFTLQHKRTLASPGSQLSCSGEIFWDSPALKCRRCLTTASTAELTVCPIHLPFFSFMSPI